MLIDLPFTNSPYSVFSDAVPVDEDPFNMYFDYGLWAGSDVNSDGDFTDGDGALARGSRVGIGA